MHQHVCGKEEPNLVLREQVQPWIDTTFTITVNIEGNLIHIQGMHAQIQGSTLDIEVTEE